MTAFTHDPAFPVMLMDILGKVLSRADNPGKAGMYLTEELRELTGANCVMLVHFLDFKGDFQFRIVGFNPQRRRGLVDSSEVARLIEMLRMIEKEKIWEPEPQSPEGLILQQLGMGPSLAIPLRVGELNNGLMLFLGIPDDEYLDQVIDALRTLSATVSLVLRNAALYENQELVITERTQQLLEANLALKESEYELSLRNRIANIFLTSVGKQIFAEVMQVFLEVTSSHQGIFGYLDEGDSLAILAMTADANEMSSWTSLPAMLPSVKIKGSDLFEAIHEKKTIVSNEPFQGIPSGHLPIDRHITAPIVHLDKTIGLIQVAQKHGDYDQREVRLLEVIARSVAPILHSFLLRDRQEQEREKAVQALQESEERYRNIVHTAQEGIWVIDENALTTFANQKMSEMLGYTPAEMFKQPLTAYMDEEGRSISDNNMKRRREGIAEQHEFKFIRKDGSALWTELNANPLFDKEGRFIGALAMVADITIRKEAQRRLALSVTRAEVQANFSEALAAAAPYLQVVLSVAVQHISQSLVDACVIHFLSEDGKLLSPVASGFRQTQFENFEKAWAVLSTEDESISQVNVFATSQPVYYASLNAAQKQFLTGQDSQNWMDPLGLQSMLVVPLRAQGQPIGTLTLFCGDNGNAFTLEDQAFYLDLCDRLGMAVLNARLFEQVQAYSVSLEDHVRERTLQLEEAVHELEAFSYTVSHDLRAPLRAMNGFSQILMDDYASFLPDEARHFLVKVQGNALKMGQLVDDLLAFSRLGRQPINKQTVSLTDIVRQVRDELKIDQQNRQIEWHVGVLPACQADPVLIKQVFVNLLSNALKFTRQEKLAQIEIGCKNDALSGPPIYYIRDNGVGFDMQYADKLFTVFQRLHRAEEFEGTGVGLAIVARILQRHGGRIWAESSPGQGATFYLTFA